MYETRESNLIKLSDCVVGRQYMTLLAKTIKILSKDQTSARVLILIANRERLVEFSIDNYVQDITDELKTVKVSDCIVGDEYIDESGTHVKILRKDKQKVRVANINHGGEYDLSFKIDYFVRELQNNTSTVEDEFDIVLRDKDLEIAALKERIIVLEDQFSKAIAHEERPSKSQQRRLKHQVGRGDIEYLEDASSIEEIVDDATPTEEAVADVPVSLGDSAHAFDQEAVDLIEEPKEKPVKVRAARGSKSSKVKKAKKEKIVTSPKAAEPLLRVKGGSKKQFIVTQLKKAVQTRDSLAQALIDAGLSKHSDIEKVKGYISVIIHELEKKDGLPIIRLGSGQYKVN